MKKWKVLIPLVIIAIVSGGLVFSKFYIPYDKEKQMYKVLEGKHFTYYSYTKENKKDINNLNEYIESEYDNLLNKFGVTQMPKIEVRVFEDTTKMLDAVSSKQEAIALTTYKGIVMVLTKYVNMNEVFKHELVHTLLINRRMELMDINYSWFQEGMADYYASTDKSKDIAIKVGAMTNNLPDMDTLLSYSPEIVKEWRYSLYKSFISFICDKYGEEKLFDIADKLGTIHIISSIELCEILNTNKEDLYLEWKKYILENY